MEVTEKEVESVGALGWCVVELLGHRRLGAFVSEVTLAGAGMLRLNIPGTEGSLPATQYVSPASVYAITPTTEMMARAVADHNRPEPVQRWELPTSPQSPDPFGDAYGRGDDQDDEDGRTEF